MRIKKDIDIPCWILFLLVLSSILPELACLENNEVYMKLSSYFNYAIYFAFLGYFMNKFHTLSTNSKISSTLILLILLVCGIYSGYLFWIKGFIIIIALRKITFERKVKVIFYSYLTLVIIAMLLYFLGISVSDYFRRGFSGLGFAHANNLGLALFIIATSYSLIKDSKIKRFIAYIFTWVTVILLTSDCKTAVLSLAVYCITYIIIVKFERNDSIKKLMIVICMLLPLIIVAASIYIPKIYDQYGFLQFMNSIFSNRLMYFNRALNLLDITWFGNSIDIGSLTSNLYINGASFVGKITLDSTYLRCLFNMGIIPCIIVYIGYCKIVLNSFDNKNYKLAALIISMTIYAMFESTFIQFYSFYPFLSLLCINSKPKMLHVR